MAIAVQMDYTVDLCKPAHLIQMDVPFFTGDKNAHRFHVKLMRNGCAVNVDGITATGYMVRADKQTVVWKGETDGCDIYLTMPASCYAVAGRFRLLLRVTFGDTIETALWVEGSMREGTTEAIVDPGTTLPSLEELLAQISTMEATTAEAREAIAETMAAAADTRKATQELSETIAPPIIVSATGEVITATDSAHRPLAGLRLYGKTTQNGVPTPSAPVPLVNVGAGGNIGVKAMGKNLLNYDAWKTVIIQRGTAVWENNGVTLTATADDCYTGDGLGWEENGVEFPAKIFVTPGETISLSWEADRSYSAPVYLFPNARIEGLVSCNNTDNRPLVYTVAEGVSYVTIRFTALKAGDVISYKNIMVERGYPTTAFEPYEDGGSLTASTPNGLPGIPVTSGGNYTDASGQQWVCDEVDFGRGVYVQRVFHKHLIGSENWTTVNNCFMFDDWVAIEKVGHVIIERGAMTNYVYRVYSQLEAGEYGVTFAYNWRFRLPDMNPDNHTVEECKAWLASHPIDFYVPMQAPVETPLSTSELAAFRAMTSQYPNTTVYNDSGAGLAMEYIADTKNYIDQRISAMLKV